MHKVLRIEDTRGITSRKYHFSLAYGALADSSYVIYCFLRTYFRSAKAQIVSVVPEERVNAFSTTTTEDSPDAWRFPMAFGARSPAWHFQWCYPQGTALLRERNAIYKLSGI